MRTDRIRKLPFINIPEIKVSPLVLKTGQIYIGFQGTRENAREKRPKEDLHPGNQVGCVNISVVILAAIRETIDNSNVISKMQYQEKFGRDYDEKQFKEAATRKIRTFKYDPTKPVEIKFKGGKRAN